MSQRFALFLATLLMIGIVAIFAYTSGHGIPLVTGDVRATLMALIVPAGAVVLALLKMFDLIDHRVAEGTLDPGDIMEVFSWPSTYVYLVSALSAIITVFGYTAIPPEEQGLLVGFIVALVYVLFRSLSERPVGSEEDTIELQMVNADKKEAEAAAVRREKADAVQAAPTPIPANG